MILIIRNNTQITKRIIIVLEVNMENSVIKMNIMIMMKMFTGRSTKDIKLELDRDRLDYINLNMNNMNLMIIKRGNYLTNMIGKPIKKKEKGIMKDLTMHEVDSEEEVSPAIRNIHSKNLKMNLIKKNKHIRTEEMKIIMQGGIITGIRATIKMRIILTMNSKQIMMKIKLKSLKRKTPSQKKKKRFILRDQ